MKLKYIRSQQLAHEQLSVTDTVKVTMVSSWCLVSRTILDYTNCWLEYIYIYTADPVLGMGWVGMF